MNGAVRDKDFFFFVKQACRLFAGEKLKKKAVYWIFSNDTPIKWEATSYYKMSEKQEVTLYSIVLYFNSYIQFDM